jgi:hypothetical protein
MNDTATNATARRSAETANLSSRVLQSTDFPASGAAVVEIARDRHAPDRLVAVLQRLTPGTVFHNAYEVWFDTVDLVDRRTATTTGAAAALTKR